MAHPTRLRPPDASRQRLLHRVLTGQALWAAIAVVVLVVVAGQLRGPAFVPTVTITNPSELDISVAVSSERDGSRLLLATAEAERTKVTTQVLDQGGRWSFRFASQGLDGGVITIDRSDLEADDWKLTIPDEVIDRLLDAGAPPSPRAAASP